MAKIINVRCTGAGQHVNEIDLEDVLGTTVILHGSPIDTGRPIPERIVRKCDVCSEGRVIITREMIERNL
jgi:kynurenine formamidase